MSPDSHYSLNWRCREYARDCLTQVNNVRSHLKPPKSTLLPLLLFHPDSLPPSVFLHLRISQNQLNTRSAMPIHGLICPEHLLVILRNTAHFLSKLCPPPHSDPQISKQLQQNKSHFCFKLTRVYFCHHLQSHKS